MQQFTVERPQCGTTCICTRLRTFLWLNNQAKKRIVIWFGVCICFYNCHSFKLGKQFKSFFFFPNFDFNKHYEITFWFEHVGSMNLIQHWTNLKSNVYYNLSKKRINPIYDIKKLDKAIWERDSFCWQLYVAHKCWVSKIKSFDMASNAWHWRSLVYLKSPEHIDNEDWIAHRQASGCVQRRIRYKCKSAALHGEIITYFSTLICLVKLTISSWETVFKQCVWSNFIHVCSCWCINLSSTLH